MDGWLGLIELFVVLAFALGWGIVELVALRIDRRRLTEHNQDQRDDEPPT